MTKKELNDSKFGREKALSVVAKGLHIYAFECILQDFTVLNKEFFQNYICGNRYIPHWARDWGNGLPNVHKVRTIPALAL